MTSAVFIALGAVAVAGGVVVFAVSGRRFRLAATMLLAFGALAVVSGWLMTDPAVNRGEALKTGGLAAGSVVALYALWLNDRRRRVDEGRQEHDRERAADDRFLRAVELLGNEADQVRVGALHALAGTARSRPQYTQDVLDVLCAYLRRPFDHPDYAAIRDDAPESERVEADRWREVRLTAQRLVADLLPEPGTPNAVAYNLDLQGATLEYFDLSHRVIGQLRLRRAHLYESNSLHSCEIHGSAWFTGAVSWGHLHAHDTVFHRRAWFSHFTAHEPVDFSRTVFHGETKFANSTFHGPLSLTDTTFDHEVDLPHAPRRS